MRLFFSLPPFASAVFGRKCLACCLMASWFSVSVLRAADRPPNVIFILADDLGYGDLGCYGQKKTETPALDRMAGEGMRFTQFYCGAPVCAPSRSVLLSGLHGGHTEVRALPYNAVPPMKDEEPPLPAAAISLGALAREAGYRTACIGKWGLGSPGSTGDANAQGFDLAYGYVGHGEAHNYYPKFLWRNGQKEPTDGKYSHDLFTSEALKFIAENKDRPFFLYLPYTIPHFNIDPPSLDQYANKGWDRVSKQRAAMISRLDRDVGTILEKLKTLGIDRETLVLFSSDNGPTPENGVSLEFFDASGGLRGGKRSLYEGGLRVPMLAWWPGMVPAGVTSNYAGIFYDVLPTLADVTKVPVPKGLDGVSFLPTLLGKEQAEHPFLYWEMIEGGGAQAVRMGRWKGVLTGVSNKKSAALELYDLESDPEEKKNVAAGNPEVVARIRDIIGREHAPSRLFPLLFEERAAALQGAPKPSPSPSR